MPPTFHESSFEFEEDEQIPKHIDAFPWESDQDPSKYWLMGTDTFEYADYVVAINIDDFGTAMMLYKARQRNLDRTQANAGSIQDRTTIMHPGTPMRLRD